MTPEESSFLATLVYTKAFKSHDAIAEGGGEQGCFISYSPAEGHTLAELVDSPDVRNDIPTGFDENQWNSLLDNVKSDPAIGNMVIVDVTRNEADKAAMVTLVNPDTHEAVISYQGTASPEGWDEDLKSGYSLTNSQQEAIDYANKQTAAIAEKYGDCYVYATGHSKGGNEAALVAVECDGIDRAYAFDAPGNAQAYFEDPEHAKRASDNSYKVAYYSNENCFVSAMNQRYDAEEHWLGSGFNEWEGMENLKGILSFSPMSHSTQHLYTEGILAGKSSFSDNEVDGPAEHVKAINDLTIFLEQHLPPDDCKYLLDSLGQIVSAATQLGDKNLSEEERQKLLEQITDNLDPKTLGILLALFEEYPESAELFNALLGDEWLQTLLAQYGPDIAKWLGISEAALAALVAVAPGLVSLLGIIASAIGGIFAAQVAMYKGVTKTKMRARDAGKAISRAGKWVADVLRVHNFTEAMLAFLKQLAGQFKNSPIHMVYQGWNALFGRNPFFGIINLSFMQGIASSIISMLDSAIDAIMNLNQKRFEQAWAEDANHSTRIDSTNQSIIEAMRVLSQLL